MDIFDIDKRQSRHEPKSTMHTIADAIPWAITIVAVVLFAWQFFIR